MHSLAMFVTRLLCCVVLASGSCAVAQDELKLLSPDPQAGASFGYSVSMDGDILAVGACVEDGPAGVDQGAVYVFSRSGTDWTPQGKLQASDAASGDLFGISVSLDGDTLVVGSYLKDGIAGTNQGAAYVFVRTGSNWTEQAKLVPAVASAEDMFGSSVAVNGDTAVVGSTQHDGKRGAVSVFARNNGVWTEKARLTASDAKPEELFGNSVAVSGSTIAVGAWHADSPIVDQGAVYIFVRDGENWSQQAKLLAADPEPNDIFGHKVSLYGDTLAVGAPNVSNLQGAAYVFTRLGANWTQQAKLIPSDGSTGGEFGHVVALDGDRVAVGAPHATGAGKPFQHGTVYFYERSGQAWAERAILNALDQDAYDSLGISVALQGSTVVSGAYRKSGSAGEQQGAIYVFGLGLLSDGFSTDQGRWTRYSDSFTALGAPTLSTTEGNPPGCYEERDHEFIVSKNGFRYGECVFEFSCDMMTRHPIADQQICALQLLKTTAPTAASDWLCTLQMNGAGHIYPNTIYCAVKYDNDGVEAWENSGYIPLPDTSGWHNGKIRILPNRIVEYYVDGILRFTSSHPMVDGFSGGMAVSCSASRPSYYDNVLVTVNSSEWILDGHLPYTLQSAGLTAGNNRLFVYGGYANSSYTARTFSYECGTSRAEFETDLPIPVCSMGFVKFGDKSYSIAGWSSAVDGAPNWGRIPYVYSFDPGSHTWSDCPSVGEERFEPASCTLGKYIYVTGGQRERNRTWFNLVQRYDPTGTTGWEEVASMNTPRSGHCAVAANGKIYVMGGNNTYDPTPLDSVEIYDPATNQWSYGPPMPTPRMDFASCLVGNRVYVIGGMGVGYVPIDSVEYLDLLSGEWKAGPALPYRASRSSATSIGDTIYMVGGLIYDGTLYYSDRVYRLAVRPAPPVPDAGQDQRVEQASLSGTPVILDASGSYDPDVDPLTYTWREGGTIIAGPTTAPVVQVLLNLGDHGITLTVEDGHDGMGEDQVTVSVVDTTPPEIQQIPPVVVEQTSRDGTPVELIPAVDLANGLVGYWNFDEATGEALDLSGAGNSGTPMNGTTRVSGRVGAKAVHFDGVDDYVNMSYRFNGLGTKATLSFWFCPDTNVQAGSPTGDLINSARVGSTHNIRVSGTNNGTLCFQRAIDANNAVNLETAQTFWAANTWHLITYTWDERACNVYVDGVLSNGPRWKIEGGVATFPSPDGILGQHSSADQCALGQIAGCSGNLFRGCLDDLRVYNRALSTVEIEALFQGPRVADICDADPTITNDAPSVFPLGETVVTWTAQDASGNTASETQKVTVVDTTPPVVEGPADIVIEQANLDGTEVDVLVRMAISDICDAAPSAVVEPVGPYSLGETVVTVTATDVSSNQTTREIVVKVRDTTPPKLDGSVQIVVEQANRDGTPVEVLDYVTVEDICDANPTLTVDPPGPYPLGETVVTVKATDHSGNESTRQITVIVEDTTPPVLAVPSNVTVEQANRNGTPVALGNATASDICDAAPTITNNAPAVFPLGTTVVTWTATDDSGNSVSATQRVTVTDTTAPRVKARLDRLFGCWWMPVGLYQACFSAVDICDAQPMVSAVLVAPKWVYTEVSFVPALHEEIVFVRSGGKRRIVLTGRNRKVMASRLEDIERMGGARVENNGILCLMDCPPCQGIEAVFAYCDGKLVAYRGHDAVLRVKATDASGNTGVARSEAGIRKECGHSER